MKIGFINTPDNVIEVFNEKSKYPFECVKYNSIISYDTIYKDAKTEGIALAIKEIISFQDEVKNVVIYFDSTTFDARIFDLLVLDSVADRTCIIIDASDFTEEEHCLLDDYLAAAEACIEVMLIVDDKETLMPEVSGAFDMFQILLNN